MDVNMSIEADTITMNIFAFYAVFIAEVVVNKNVCKNVLIY